jgi:predicted nucleic-acid-binding protein
LTKALDTNIVARVIVRDDPVQVALAEKALGGPVFISLTVILETVWLLTSRFKMPRRAVVDSLIDLISIPTVECERSVLVEWALERFAAGASIGDMIHIIAASHHSAMLTFDKRMARDAGPDCPIPIEVLS